MGMAHTAVSRGQVLPQPGREAAMPRQDAKCCVLGAQAHWYAFELGVLNFNQTLKRVQDQKRNSSGRQNHA